MSSALSQHDVRIVDDHDDIRATLATVLRMARCEVAAAWSAEDGLRQLRQGFRPCVVLLDLRMPHMNGWAFLGRMRAQPDLEGVAVVIVSGDAYERDRAALEGCDFLLKPMEPARVLAAIERGCRRHPFPP